MTGSITARPAPAMSAVPGADGEFDGEDVTGSIGKPTTKRIGTMRTGEKSPADY